MNRREMIAASVAGAATAALPAACEAEIEINNANDRKTMSCAFATMPGWLGWYESGGKVKFYCERGRITREEWKHLWDTRTMPHRPLRDLLIVE